VASIASGSVAISSLYRNASLSAAEKRSLTA
jgi:hypothetical protein